MRNHRPSRAHYYLGIARAVSERASCLRAQVGAVIVYDDVILSTGYCGAPRGVQDCMQSGVCQRELLRVPSGSQYELCKSVHAEQNACLHANHRDMQGATMYLYYRRWSGASWERQSPEDRRLRQVMMEELQGFIPCEMCRRVLRNCRLSHVVAQVADLEGDLWVVPEGDTVGRKMVVYDVESGLLKVAPCAGLLDDD